ncbi:MAG TPA: phosphonate C-P lyase system protein PhnG [Aliidongia sp.]|uniref:phosphonate C-P lyase system protein PhnG n=1 Tax=Aliidongia sp. TaxID=1914230 RepID=UPI002DDD6B03|nr:phosphonate C-P lyase system protein PhnG [Aliidongia sp.]HEV2675572.1 phosphonate C-P lyase system protein PhnG [Aliidongia sp.]
MSRQISDSSNPGEFAGRQGWMATLAKAPLAALEQAWAALDPPPVFTRLRPTETGLVMVRGRISGSGRPFNLGEMTMTRAAVRLEAGATGFGHVAGRSTRHAELAALFDALLQDPALHDDLMVRVVGPLAVRASAERQRKASEVAATKVDFFTLVRGEDR